MMPQVPVVIKSVMVAAAVVVERWSGEGACWCHLLCLTVTYVDRWPSVYVDDERSMNVNALTLHAPRNSGLHVGF